MHCVCEGVHASDLPGPICPAPPPALTCLPRTPFATAAADDRRRGPWSVFVPQPHLKVAGVVGITARAPLIHVAHGSSAAGSVPGGGGGGPTSLFQALGSSRVEWVQDLGGLGALPRLLRGGKAGEGGDGPLSAERREAVRPFASGAASLQFGRFTGNVLDFTRLSAKMDVGLWGPEAKGEALKMAMGV